MGNTDGIDDIVVEALELFEESQEGSYYNREHAEEDIRFGRLGDQWPETIKDQRQKEGRPCLTINKIPAFIRQVVNESRQNKPGIVVSPIDNGADPETADVISGLFRSIERNSNAGIAYDTAIDHAVSGGFGFFQVVIDHANDDTFDMEIRIERIFNPLMVHWDTHSTMFDASDWDYAFVSDFLKMDEYEKRYPKASKIDFESDRRVFHEQYLEGDRVQVAQYWLREEEEHKLLQLSDGQAIREENLIEMGKELLKAGGVDSKGMSPEEIIGMYLQMAELKVARERTVTVKKVKRRILNGIEVLEEDDWPGSTIPICPVWGEEVTLDGRRYFRSMIRDVRDSQTLFNFMRSASAEMIALQPKAPFIGPVGFVPKGQEKKWASANNRAHAYLEYETKDGMKPERQPFAGPATGLITEAGLASDDMKAIMGIYDSSLGERSNETSGRAILARQKESDVSNFHFLDNLSRAIQYCGRVIVEIIPSVYKNRQLLRILGEDQKEKIIKLGQGESQDQSGGEKLYDLSVGKYDVTVKAGPSYSSQREETRETLIEIMRAVPDSGIYITDKILQLMDFQGAEDLAKRAKLLLPQHIQEAEAKENAKDLPPEMQEIVQQGEQIINGLKQKVQQLEDEQAPEMAKVKLEGRRVDIEEARARKELNEPPENNAPPDSEILKVQLENQKAANEAAKIDADLLLKQEANTLTSRKLDLEEQKLRLEERKVVAEEIEAMKEPASQD